MIKQSGRTRRSAPTKPCNTHYSSPPTETRRTGIFNFGHPLQRPEIGRGDAALRSRLVGRGDLEQGVLPAGFGAEDEGKRQAGLGDGGGLIVVGGDEPRAVLAQLEYRIVRRAHVARRHEHFRQPRVRPALGFGP